MSTLHLPSHFITPLLPYLPPNAASPSQSHPSQPHPPSGTLPHLTLTYATSLDSTLSLSPSAQTVLSGPLSKAMTHYLRSVHDAILVGVGTAIADDPGLNSRIAKEATEPVRQPRPIILDPRARWQVTAESRVIRTAREGKGLGPWVLVAAPGVYDIVMRGVVESVGGAVIGLPPRRGEVGGGGRCSWRDILAGLGERGVGSVMVEGGAGVINGVLADMGEDDDSDLTTGTTTTTTTAGEEGWWKGERRREMLVKSVIVTIAPVFLGKGGAVVAPPRAQGEEDREVLRLEGVVWVPMDEDVVLCGKPKRRLK
ncbi:MAG: hypothetical protein M4579_006523 [Chaenotheca gracillima]|nr:MAG: hypothetical protein M4579_006523 [Chaenotheca gracillima]